MQQLFHEHTAWQRTFPHLVRPFDDEWLPGLLLRCDEVNHWGSGMTMTHFFRFFFAQGTPHLLAHALQLIREKLKKGKLFK